MRQAFQWLRFGLVCALLMVPTTRLRAWGPVGHETVAYIAEDNLTATARAKIAQILGRDVDLADVSNWADQIRATTRPETAPWHFIDIEDRVPESEADESKFCPNHNCVVDQIDSAVSALKKAGTTPAQRFDALRFLIHFVGDAHQPLHTADDNDRGGNDKLVRVKRQGRGRGTALKLHAYWDRLLEIKTTEDRCVPICEDHWGDCNDNYRDGCETAIHDRVYCTIAPVTHASVKRCPRPSCFSTTTNVMAPANSRNSRLVASSTPEGFG